VGTVLQQPELAQTLLRLSKEGAPAFYAGSVAKAVATTVQAAGGLVTEADLAAYRTQWRAPLEGSYRGHRILTMPPPSAGGLIVLQVLGLLEAAGAPGPAARDVDGLHLYLEGLRRAFADRAKHLGDPAFAEVPVEQLRSAEHLAAWRAGIDPTKATPSASLAGPAGDAGALERHTTHVSVVDAKGNAVALTTTINFYFGACLVAKGTGVLLNDQMDDFATRPGLPNAYGLVEGVNNAVGPGKRPAHLRLPEGAAQGGAAGRGRLGRLAHSHCGAAGHLGGGGRAAGRDARRGPGPAASPVGARRGAAGRRRAGAGHPRGPLGQGPPLQVRRPTG
jgi:gamma-glutamyltranspeptidase / glutathione hydrolase